MVNKSTYVSLWNPPKPDIGAVLDNWVAGGAEIHVYILAVVHAELATVDDDDAIAYSSQMCRSTNLTTEE
jgi:hypothetical protein